MRIAISIGQDADSYGANSSPILNETLAANSPERCQNISELRPPCEKRSSTASCCTVSMCSPAAAGSPVGMPASRRATTADRQLLRPYPRRRWMAHARSGDRRRIVADATDRGLIKKHSMFCKGDRMTDPTETAPAPSSDAPPIRRERRKMVGSAELNKPAPSNAQLRRRRQKWAAAAAESMSQHPRLGDRKRCFSSSRAPKPIGA